MKWKWSLRKGNSNENKTYQVFSAPTRNLPEQSKAERTLGLFPTRRYCRQRAQASVSNGRLPFPYLSKPLSGVDSPSHQWIQMNTLYLKKVLSPTTNWASSMQDKLICKRQEVKGQLASSLKGAPRPRSNSKGHWDQGQTHGCGYAEGFRVPFSPWNGCPVQVVLHLNMANLA